MRPFNAECMERWLDIVHKVLHIEIHVARCQRVAARYLDGMQLASTVIWISAYDIVVPQSICHVLQSFSRLWLAIIMTH